MCVPVLLGKDLEDDAMLCPMIDARRAEVYAAVYDRALHPLRPAGADIVEPGANPYLEFLERGPVYFFGNGAGKCREALTHPNAHFVDDIRPLARWMFPLAEKAVAREPFYLKEFVASKPKKLI